MTDTLPSSSAPAEQEQDSGQGQTTKDRRMRIHLPDGAIRQMTLAEYQEFLVTYRITTVTPEEPV